MAFSACRPSKMLRCMPPLLFLLLQHLLHASGFWDNGHLLTAEIAKQYLELSGDLIPLLMVHASSCLPSFLPCVTGHPPTQVLSIPDGLTGLPGAFTDLTDSAVWMDQIKCTTASPNCPIPTLPAFHGFNNWHYGGRCITVNFYPEVADPCPGTDRLDSGLLLTALSGTIDTFSHTKSISAAAMQIRILIHLMGDLHQPLHCSGGAVDANWPQGDQGGNLRRFPPYCNATQNMHALWDSGGLKYVNNWSPDGYLELYPKVRANASAMIASGVGLPDPIGYAGLDLLTFPEFVAASSGAYGFFARTMHEQAQLAKEVAYRYGIKLNPKFVGGTLDCPSDFYLQVVQNVTDRNIGRAGYRLYHVLRRLSRHIVESGLVKIPPSAGDQPDEGAAQESRPAGKPDDGAAEESRRAQVKQEHSSIKSGPVG